VSCTTSAPKRETYDLINAEMSKLVAESKVEQIEPDAVSASLLPPLQIERPPVRQPLEQRFSLAFNNLPANQFFMALVNGTPYSMLVPPEVTGTISANLKDVTVFEALDAIREMYGYDYKVEGTRIYVKPLSLQTRVFQVNYLVGSRQGSSDLRVSNGTVTMANNGGGSGTNSGNTPSNGAPGSTTKSIDSSKVTTSTNSDFWGELRESLETIVGAGKDGRSVVISPQSGVVVVRAMWDELRSVTAYLKATQLSVDRQVILEAKILEVQLNDSYQAGINWAAFSRSGNNRFSVGRLPKNASLSPTAREGLPQVIGQDGLVALPGEGIVTDAANLGGLFGLAFQSSNFAALLSFLETQGTVHVLSSPRISTMNNQKAVLKVGRDELFVTGLSTTTTTVGDNIVTNPNVTLQPFFSGVALDVTPQIDDSGNVTLHIHPTVSNVVSIDTPLNLGTGGLYSLPLASNTISETDSVVKGRDGQVIAIGGLMRQAASSDRSQLPGASNIPVLGRLLRNTNEISEKRELVILLKPIIVHNNNSWSQELTETQRSIQSLDPQTYYGKR
jgi:MSHA biogenesis protein MshL